MQSIEEHIAAALGIDVRAVTDDLEYGAIPQWDSLGHVSLMTALESAYGVEIDEDHMVDLTNVRAIRDFVTDQGTHV